MTNALCVGFGKMGQWTYDCLKEVKGIDHIYVVDPKADFPPSTNKTTFLKDYNSLPPIDFAFIITPTVTHHAVLKKTLQMGIKKIFIEKPALKTEEEFADIAPLVKDSKIAVGYILRQSKALADLKKQLTSHQKEGYRLTDCHVAYMKDKTNDPRSKNDFGIYEEVYHVWDLLFNYLELSKADKMHVSRRNVETDLTRPERHIAENIHYRLAFGDYTTNVSIVSSFKAPNRKRIFSFVLENEQKQLKKLVLSFDEADGFDKIKLFQNDKLEWSAQYPAKEKLKNQIQSLCHYFETGEQTNLHFFENSLTLQDIYKFTTQHDRLKINSRQKGRLAKLKQKSNAREM